MKTLLMILTMVCSLAANAAIRTVIKTDSANQVKYLYELNDTIIKGKQVTDTLSITEAEEDDVHLVEGEF